MREVEEGWRRGKKVMLLTLQFETTFFSTFFFFTLSLCHCSICTPHSKKKKQPPHFKDGINRRWRGGSREGDLKKERETGYVNFLF